MRFRDELMRKSFHLAWVFVLLVFFIIALLFGQVAGLFVLLLLVCVSLVFDSLRIRYGIVPHKFKKLFRSHEWSSVSATSMGLLGILLALALFDIHIASVAILMMTFGDAAAGLARRFSRVKIGSAFLECLVLESVVNFAVAFIVFEFIFPISSIWLVSLCMALAASIVENYLKGVDDNLTIPLFAGLIGQLLVIL